MHKICHATGAVSKPITISEIRTRSLRRQPNTLMLIVGSNADVQLRNGCKIPANVRP